MPELANTANQSQTPTKQLKNDKDLAVIQLNQSLQITSYTPEAAHLFAFLSPGFKELNNQIESIFGYGNLFDDIKEVTSTLIAKTIEVEHHNGTPYSLVINCINGFEDNVIGSLISFANLTERRQNQIELDKYQDYFAQIKRAQEAGRVGFWAAYADKEFLEWSEETYRMFDLPKDQFLTFADMLNYVHPEDRNWVDEMWTKATFGEDYALSYRIVTPTKKVRWIEVYGDVIVDGNGQFVRAFGIVRNISKQKEVEIKLATLANTLKHSQKIGNLGSWTLQASSNYMEVNDEARAMFHFPEGKKVSTEIWFSAIHPDDQNRVRQSWLNALKGSNGLNIEYKIIVDGTIKWIKGVCEIEYNSENEFVKAVGVVKDITDHVNQQNALRVAKEQAEAANKLKSAFLANMSHEIRTPLNGIIGFSEILSKTHLEGTQKKYINIVNQSAHGLIGLINDILDFSKIEAGKLKLDEEVIDLVDLAEQVKNIVIFKAEEKGLAVKVNIEQDVPQHILTDGLKLKQVLVNLMSNAIKFTNEGEVEFKISMIRTEKNTFRFSVRDTGIGIKEEHKSTIFDAFTQGDRSTTKKYGGTGLGLSISNGILALLDSHLKVESQEGKGSLFYFDVALNKEDHKVQLENDKKLANDNLKTEIVQFEKRAPKMLIVEDNEINLMLIRLLLEELVPKAILLEAHNGKEAVELFERDQPDLILMDIQMPVMNGHDATLKIRELELQEKIHTEENKHTTIIAVSAGAMETDKEKCLEVGMDDFISKPIDAESFRALITNRLMKGSKNLVGTKP